MRAISVIIPVYNTQEYLRRCVNSVLSQSFENFELILVDDGSTDESGAMCDAFAAEDGRVRVIHKQNVGLNSAVIAGIEAAKSKYTVFCDSDDEMTDGALDFLYHEITHSGVDAVRTSVKIRSDDGRAASDMMAPTRVYNREEIYKEIICAYFCQEGVQGDRAYRAAWGNLRTAKIYKTELLKRVAANLNPTTDIGTDLVLNLNYLFECESVKITNEHVSYIYYIREDSVSHSYDMRLVSRYIKLFNELRQIAAQHGLKGLTLDRYFDTKIVNSLCTMLYGNSRIADKIKLIQANYEALINKTALIEEAKRSYLVLRPGLYLIAAGAIAPGVILTCAVLAVARLVKRALGSA